MALVAALIARVYRQIIDEQITTVAASVAFFVVLAVFPGLAAVIAMVATFTNPGEVDRLLSALSGVIPSETADFLSRQIDRLADGGRPAGERGQAGIAPLFGFAVLLWSANRGTKALFRALNRMHDAEEQRGFVAFTALTLAFTVGAIVFLVFSVVAVIVIPLALTALTAGNVASWLDALRWPVLLVIVSGVFAVLYRFAPNRPAVHWRAIAAGSVLAALLWVCISFLFSWYMSAFGALTNVYGPLSAVIGFMIWIWLSVIALLVGAELDAAIERHDKQASD